jgi:hypothetical protein
VKRLPSCALARPGSFALTRHRASRYAPEMKTVSTLLIATAALTLAACGGDDGGGAEDCESYGAASLDDAFAEADDLAAPGFAQVQGKLNTDALFDVFALELYAGSGALAGGIAPGTYTISGVETNYATCGVCARIFTDIDAEGNDSGVYVASGGTVTITSVTPNFVASVSGLELIHAEIDPTTFETTPHADGCTASIDSASVDLVTAMAPQ